MPHVCNTIAITITGIMPNNNNRIFLAIVNQYHIRHDDNNTLERIST